jgi:hypothetical protein
MVCLLLPWGCSTTGTSAMAFIEMDCGGRDIGPLPFPPTSGDSSPFPVAFDGMSFRPDGW